MLDVNRNWEIGDFLRSRFLVWQRHHMLHLLMGTAQEDHEDLELDYSSFLQTNAAQRRSGDVVSDCSAEVCINFKQQLVHLRDEVDEVSIVEGGQAEFLPMWVAQYLPLSDSEAKVDVDVGKQSHSVLPPVLHQSSCHEVSNDLFS